MYFPYLRGKVFELEALTEVSQNVFLNTIPIIEPINVTTRGKTLYRSIVSRLAPFVLIMNPVHLTRGPLTTVAVQDLIDTTLRNHTSLNLGFIINQNFNLAELNAFLISNPTRPKSLIFQHSPFAAEIRSIQAAIGAHPVTYIIFDDRSVDNPTRNAFANHSGRVLITDGFQRKSRNLDYRATSTFASNFATWRNNGWAGIGDYLTMGDHVNDGGGGAYVITLHITRNTQNGILTHHFSSTYQPTVQGLTAPKFAEANALLVTSLDFVPLNSSGLTLYRGWHNTKHNPQLGAAKKASMMHHIELMSSLV
jgi:hypothetical protein